MPKHDHFQELCALAMSGDASGHEQRELKAHLDICSECRQEYREFVQLVLPQLSLAMDAVPTTEPSPSERNAIRSRFLAHAQRSGIGFTEGTFSARTSCDPPRSVTGTLQVIHRRNVKWHEVATAACLLLAASGAGYWALRPSNSEQTMGVSSVPKLAAPQLAGVDKPIATLPPSTTDDSGESATNRELQARLNVALDELGKNRELLSRTDAEKERLVADLKQREDRLALLATDNETSKGVVAELRAQLDQQRSRASVEEANFVAAEVRVRDLTEQLAARNTEVERDRQVMSVKGQNLMATRNLHIVDVFDSDSGGRVKGPSGRIFIVDEKQLIFYAYDLNETRLQDAKYAYRVWGQKEGPGKVAKALGVFASDDKSQRRWVFTCDDPKTLSQIDSVFVTVGPASSPQPHGEKLMYAYLRGPVNHP